MNKSKDHSEHLSQEKVIKHELKLHHDDHFVAYSAVLKTNREEIANIIVADGK